MLGTCRILRRINQLEKKMTKEFNDVQDGLAVIRKGVLDSVAKINELSAALASAQAADDPAAVEAVAVELKKLAADLETAAGV